MNNVFQEIMELTEIEAIGGVEYRVLDTDICDLDSEHRVWLLDAIDEAGLTIWDDRVCVAWEGDDPVPVASCDKMEIPLRVALEPQWKGKYSR